MLKKINKQFFIERLKERSTWQGLIAILSALGVAITPEMALKIISAGTALAGFVSVITADKE